MEKHLLINLMNGRLHVSFEKERKRHTVLVAAAEAFMLMVQLTACWLPPKQLISCRQKRFLLLLSEKHWK